jgi:anti-sigma factor RsiW
MTRLFPRTDRFHCPGDEQLAAYVDQQLIGAERQRVESHLAKCNTCLQQVGFLVRQTNLGKAEAPAWLVQKAAQLPAVPIRNTPVLWKWAPLAAGVAAVALGLTLWLHTQTPEKAPAPLIASAPAPSSVAGVTPPVLVPPDTAVRNATTHFSAPVILSPESGATVRMSALEFRWEPLASAVAYEVRVVTADGDLVWEKKVRATSVAPSPNISLKKGSKYFIWVRAVFLDGKTQQSDPVGFTAG